MSRLYACLLVAAAAFPLRIYSEFAVFRSFSLLDVILACTALVLLLGLARTGRLFVGDGFTFTLLAAPAAIAALSIAWSVQPAVSARYAVHSLEALVAYLAAVAAFRRQPARFVFSAMAWFVVALFAGSALFYLQVPGFERPVVSAEADLDSPEYADWLTGFVTRLGHPFIGQSNVFATALVFFVPLFIAYARFADSRWARAAAVLCLAGIVLTQSRGALLALALALLVYALLAPRDLPPLPLRRWLPAAALGVAAVGGVAALALSEPDAARFMLAARADAESWHVRLRSLDLAAEQLARRPALGSGAGTASLLHPELAVGVHNTYLEQLVSYGIPLGLAACLSLLLLPLAGKVVPRTGSTAPLDAGLLAAIAALLLAFLTQASYESGPLRVLLALSLGMAISLVRAAGAVPERPA
jgi:O-antigen ligase